MVSIERFLYLRHVFIDLRMIGDKFMLLSYYNNKITSIFGFTTDVFLGSQSMFPKSSKSSKLFKIPLGKMSGDVGLRWFLLKKKISRVVEVLLKSFFVFVCKFSTQ